MFELHPVLEKDTIHIGDFELSQLLWMNDSQYPWAILVPKINGIREVFELDSKQQQQLMLESNALLQAMNIVFSADKMNLAALGNMVPQLHIHHIARFQDDVAWPNPVWGVSPAIAYTAEQLAMAIQPLLKELTEKCDFKEAAIKSF
ncbi:MAG: HIT domain-containing protein [Kangiellaceae bacterium]|nr:HIT domain-containing protein [Kangiellaceae bacterium]